MNQRAWRFTDAGHISELVRQVYGRKLEAHEIPNPEGPKKLRRKARREWLHERRAIAKERR